MRFFVACCLLAVLSGCVATPPAPATLATSRALDNDRLLVTLHPVGASGVTALSPSGRLGYRAPSNEELRAANWRVARELAAKENLDVVEDWPIPSLDVYCFVFGVPAERRRETVMASLAEHPQVESVQALQFFRGRTDGTGDPLAGTDDALNRRLVSAHAMTSGRDVTVAVIDAGLDIAHEDLAGASITSLDLVDGLSVPPAEAHGTAVVGLLAAQPDNGLGIRGIAPGANLLLLRACWETDAAREITVCNSLTLAKALSLALESGADIVNLSVAGPRDPLLERIGAQFAKHNVLLVAAGNDSAVFPVSIPGSIASGRVLPEGSGASLTLLPDNRYGLRNGDSMATAKVTGIVALLRQLHPELDSAAIEQRLNARSLLGVIDALLAEASPAAD